MKTELEKDLNYIDKEVIAIQPNGSYCKYSKLLKAVACYNFTEDEYIAFWLSLHKKDFNEQKLIVDACKKKLTFGLISRRKMINLIKESKDDEKEKQKVLNYLKGKETRINISTYVKSACTYYAKNKDKFNEKVS